MCGHPSSSRCLWWHPWIVETTLHDTAPAVNNSLRRDQRAVTIVVRRSMPLWRRQS